MVYVFGHKNPDTDSVTAAIALSALKNKLGLATKPGILGQLNKETKYVLDYFNVPYPQYIENVKTQVKDLNYEQVEGIEPTKSILYAYKLMEENNIKVLPIVNKEKMLLGIVTMKDIAMGLIKGDYYHLETDVDNIIKALDGLLLTGRNNQKIKGVISVISYYYETMVKEHIIHEESIVIVGDRYDVIEHAINSNVQLIIVTGGNELPAKYIAMAKEQGINLLSVKRSTYATAKLINQCNYVSSIMKKKDIVKFNQYEYLDEIKEELINNRHSNYPVVTEDNKYLGFIGRRHILSPNRKKVILVDHNEYAQSVEGLSQAEIIEVVDHHKIGDILTTTPIDFRNMPVGSTCTIVFHLYKEAKISIDRKIAGLLLSGIISDTLSLKSPTTTPLDIQAVEELAEQLNIDVAQFSLEMFKAGTSLEGQSIEEIFYKDFKEFKIKDHKIGIGQVFTLDIEDIFNRKVEFLEYLQAVQEKGNYYLILLLITDILRNGSYLFYKSKDPRLVDSIFNLKAEQGVFIPDILSRKKQVIPQVMETINNLYLE
ncbi:MAG: putative manganese-dependent inorganic diphosphatase [Clostridia bacterium]|jgi:manganese-dependent inorganic pyrophosphatase|nr:putative manganese-dependent inorganic diphosphatase [Clostridia bacterium]